MGFHFRALRTDPERREYLDQFCAQLARKSGGSLALTIATERIAHCTHVVGVFDDAGAMVAGYIVNLGPRLVLLSVMPEGPRAAWLARVPLEEQAELNLIWRNQGIGHVTFALLVWPRIIRDCVTCGRAYILGSGYENPLNHWYRSVDPELVYDGPSTTSGLRVFVYAYTRPRLVGTYFASAIDNFVRALLRKRQGRSV